MKENFNIENIFQIQMEETRYLLRFVTKSNKCEIHKEKKALTTNNPFEEHRMKSSICSKHQNFISI